jgi:hypothetical protein
VQIRQRSIAVFALRLLLITVNLPTDSVSTSKKRGPCRLEPDRARCPFLVRQEQMKDNPAHARSQFTSSNHASSNGVVHKPQDELLRIHDEDWWFVCSWQLRGAVAAIGSGSPEFKTGFNTILWSSRTFEQDAKDKRLIVVMPQEGPDCVQGPSIEKRCRDAGAKITRTWIIGSLGTPEFPTLEEWEQKFTLERTLRFDRPWKAKRKRLAPGSAGESTEGEDGRLEIEVNTERHLSVEASIEALAADRSLYRRGDSLGTVVEERGTVVKLADGVKLQGARGSSRFLPISDANLSCILTKNARFYYRKTDKAGELTAVDCHPPTWLISAVATRGSWPGVRPLLGIASSPWVRADGSIPHAGYDQATGTLYRPAGKLATMPNRPTRKDAQDSSKRLRSLVRDFPFASEEDWNVWLAGLFTAIQRPAIFGPVPGFVFNGNKAGTGKGLLVDAIGLIVWLSGIPTRSYPVDPIEAAKIKLSLALSGLTAVHFDNVPEGGFYGNAELDSAVTSTMVEGRILGRSQESGPVPLRPCWFLTGNNISPGKDAFRRWIPSNLRTELENPHERSDVGERDLRQYIKEHRAELLRDALVILSAHAIAGYPSSGKAPLGSFEEWDAFVRGAVWFATGNDCLATQREAAKDSPDRLQKLALLEGWSQLPDGKEAGVTLAEAIRFVEHEPLVYSMLHAAFMAMSKDSKLPGNKAIGNKIKSMNYQNIGGWRFEKMGERDHSALWRACKL